MKPDPQRRPELTCGLPGFGRLLLTVILELQLPLRARFLQGVVGSHLHFMVPGGNNVAGSGRALGFIALICYSETYAASWSQEELCIISYLQRVNLMFVSKMSQIPSQLNINMSVITHIESMLP